jgi:hypothetical protein
LCPYLLLYCLGCKIVDTCDRIITYGVVMCEELSDLYSLPNIVRVVKSRRIIWAGNVGRIGEGRGVHRVMMGKPDGKRPLGRPRHRWEDNIKMDLPGRGRW